MKSALEIAQWAALPFISDAERQDAYANPEYQNPANEAYRHAVYAKEALTPAEIGPAVRSLGVANTVYVGDTQAASLNTESGRAEAAARKADEQAHAEIFGALSIRPSEGK